jgi:hypothetical protein
MEWKFWVNKTKTVDSSSGRVQKLPKPTDIPDPVGRYLIVERGKNPDWVWNLKAVILPRQEEKDCYDVRIFDKGSAAEKNVMVKDYTSLDGYPELILYEGWFNKKSMDVHIEEKKTKTISRAA